MKKRHCCRFCVLLMFSLVFLNSCSLSKKKTALSSNELIDSLIDTPPIHIDREKSYKEKHLFVQNVADVEYVLLETLSESLLGDIYNHLKSIRLTDTDIFIGMKDDVLHFDRNGYFLNKIGKRGQGPEEYSLFTSFVVDESKKEIIINDDMGYRLFFYKYDGTYVKNIKYDGYVNQIELISDNLLCCYSTHLGVESAITLRSLANGEKVKVLSPIYHSRGYFITGMVLAPSKYKNEVYMNTYETDTIFSVNEQGRTPRYIFLPPNDLKNIHDCDICSTPFLICETDVFAYFQSYGKDINGGKHPIPTYYIVDKKSQEIFKGYIADMELSRPINAMSCGVDNQFVALIEVERIQRSLEAGHMSGKFKELALTLEDEGNPVLMIATIRK